MSDGIEAWICEATGATSAHLGEPIQQLWAGYGEIRRVPLTGAAAPSAVLKRVTPPHVDGWGRGHQRKLRSYQVETAFYRGFAARCGERCRVPRHIASAATDSEFRILLEDLDEAGFPARRHNPQGGHLELCLAWLANLHATFLGEAPTELWPQGTYWHLATRPDELALIDDEELRAAAPRIDDALAGARFKTFVHGDAKPANFCFSRDGRAVAAVDFQYVGGGCGMKDVAYLCSHDRDWQRHLDTYFGHLRSALSDIEGREPIDADAVEAEGRALYPLALADFHRFLAGWSASRRTLEGYRETLRHPAVERTLGAPPDAGRSGPPGV